MRMIGVPTTGNRYVTHGLIGTMQFNDDLSFSTSSSRQPSLIPSILPHQVLCRANDARQNEEKHPLSHISFCKTTRRVRMFGPVDWRSLQLYVKQKLKERVLELLRVAEHKNRGNLYQGSTQWQHCEENNERSVSLHVKKKTQNLLSYFLYYVF